MMGKQAGLKEGNYYSGITPIGYKSELQENGKRSLVVDPFSSRVVKDMYKLYSSGRSLGEIGDYVQKKYGVYADRDRRSAADQCGRVLRNPVYAGRVFMNDLEYSGKHEALVSPEVWQKVNDRLSQNKKAYKRAYSGSDGLLSGLLFCGDCGARMSIRQWGFICPNYASKATEKAPEKSIDEIATEVLAGRWGNNPERKQKLEAAGYNYEAVQAAVNQKAKSGASAKKSVSAVAQEVLAGKWGNNPARKKALEAAGYDYNAVQAEVNRLCQK